MRIRAPAGAAYAGGLGVIALRWGLDAGRGTTPVTGVASAIHPLKIGASGATASITDLCITWFDSNQLRSCSVPRRGMTLMLHVGAGRPLPPGR